MRSPMPVAGSTNTISRYPNGFDRGAPTDYYTSAEAEAAIADAHAILEVCRGAMG